MDSFRDWATARAALRQGLQERTSHKFQSTTVLQAAIIFNVSA